MTRILAILSRIKIRFRLANTRRKFSFVNNVSEAYNIKVTDVKITNANSTGTLTIDADADNEWSNVAGDPLELNFGAVGTTSEGVADAIAHSAEGETYNELLMIPSAATESYNVTFTVELLNGEVSMNTYSHTATISGVELKLGYCYDFKAVLDYATIDPDEDLKPIVFEVDSIEPWIDTDQNHDITLNE